MAEAVGAQTAFFSTCGSSLSVKAAMMAVAGGSGGGLLGRDSHESVVAGLILSGCAATVGLARGMPTVTAPRNAGWPPRARIHGIPADGCPAGIVGWARCRPPGRRRGGAVRTSRGRGSPRRATLPAFDVLLSVRTVMVRKVPGSSAFMRPRTQCFIRRVAASSSRLRSSPGRNAPVAWLSCRRCLADSAEHLRVPADRGGVVRWTARLGGRRSSG